MFIDYTKVELQTGHGGSGRVSFRREKYVPKGGPDGGNGGRGGHIILVVDSQLHTLQDVRYKHIYKAENGKPGGSNLRTGRNGEDVRIPIPQGTVIKNPQTGEIVADLVNDGDEFIACSGGAGGKGNASFKSATQRAPRHAQPGLPGERKIFELELKVLADVGLVGLPNSGKSTLLSRISAARPKIADYPFTTLQPHLGIVKYGDFQSFVMADIPGLIEGASDGKGLGHRFLRHIERNRLLLFLIEALDENPQKTMDSLKNELEHYNLNLMQKPYIVARSKYDIITQKAGFEERWEKFKEPFIDISAVTGYGIPNIIKTIAEKLDGQ